MKLRQVSDKSDLDFEFIAQINGTQGLREYIQQYGVVSETTDSFSRTLTHQVRPILFFWVIVIEYLEKSFAYIIIFLD